MTTTTRERFFLRFVGILWSDRDSLAVNMEDAVWAFIETIEKEAEERKEKENRETMLMILNMSIETGNKYTFKDLALMLHEEGYRKGKGYPSNYN